MPWLGYPCTDVACYEPAVWKGEEAGMNDEYAVLSHITLHAGMPCQRPGGLMPHVNAGDPAISVMTDFRKVTPVTIEPGLSIDTAIRKMKASGVRLLLVPDRDDRIIGIITASDIQGERPFRLGQELGVARADIRVEMLMVPLDRVMAVDMVTVHDACVGHIIVSLRKLERHHTLVVETDRDSGIQMIRGLFSISHISKMMGHEVAHVEYPAHSLAEVQQELG
jgi:CBS domain